MAEGVTVVAIGTWLYDGKVQKRVELLCCPAAQSGSRWVEDDNGEFVLDETASIPRTPDGNVYYVGATEGGEFFTLADAIAWADKQPWGPVTWKFLGS